MKIRIDHASLAEAATAAAKPIPARPSIPILACALISVSASENRMTVHGYDYTTSLSCTVDCAADEDVTLAVPGRVLAKLAAGMPSGAVTITVDGGAAVLTGRGVRYRLNTLNIDDYPALPVPPAPVVEVDGADLALRLSQTAPAASSDASINAAMTCVRIQVAPDGRIVLATTDRYQAARAELPYEADTTVEQTMLLTARDLAETVSGLVGLVRIGWDDNLVSFRDDRTVITLQRAAEQFPPLDTFFSAPNAKTHIGVDLDDLADAAARTVQILGGSKNPMRVTATADGLTYAGDSELNEQVDGEIDCTLDGDEVTFGCNPNYLRAGLKAHRSRRADIAVTTPAKPLLITFPDDPASVYVLMPVKFGSR